MSQRYASVADLTAHGGEFAFACAATEDRHHEDGKKRLVFLAGWVSNLGVGTRA